MLLLIYDIHKSLQCYVHCYAAPYEQPSYASLDFTLFDVYGRVANSQQGAVDLLKIPSHLASLATHHTTVSEEIRLQAFFFC